MSDWRLHWLEAEGDLQCWRSQVECEIGAARMAITGLISAPRRDILVQRIAGAVIPEIGIGGHTYRKSLFALTLDPDNQHFAASLAEGALRRMVAHEVHHCLRMAGLAMAAHLEKPWSVKDWQVDLSLAFLATLLSLGSVPLMKIFFPRTVRTPRRSLRRASKALGVVHDLG
jgi:hypothetical protein